jgi:hypothetical protein
VRAFDEELAQVLADRFPGEILDVPHRLFGVVARSPSTT